MVVTLKIRGVWTSGHSMLVVVEVVTDGGRWGFIMVVRVMVDGQL
jgi:hypothetical protein